MKTSADFAEVYEMILESGRAVGDVANWMHDATAALIVAEARIAELELEREGHIETCIELNKQLREFAARIAELEAAQ